MIYQLLLNCIFVNEIDESTVVWQENFVPVRPTIPTFHPGCMSTLRFFRTAGSNGSYFSDIFSNLTWPVCGHDGGGSFFGVGSCVRSVYWMTRSTLVINCADSADWRTPYWTIPVRISACDMARPTFPLNVAENAPKVNKFQIFCPGNDLPSYSTIKLYVTQATNAVLTQSNHKPSAVFEQTANCHVPLWTSCSVSNSFDNWDCSSLERIVEIPRSVAVRWEKTGLLAEVTKLSRLDQMSMNCVPYRFLPVVWDLVTVLSTI